MTPTLLERDAPLNVLRAAYEDAAGEGRLVLVGGEAGVGKTALLRAFAADVDARVLVGACEPLFTPRPLGPIVDVAAQTGGGLASLTAEGARTHEVLNALLEELRREPTVLVLEDVHWADEATLDLLRLLGRRVEVPRAFVVVTYRDDELDAAHPLRQVLGGLASAHGTQRLSLSPLSLEAVRFLCVLHRVNADELHSLTGGNPFFVTEVLGGGGKGLPETARDAVLARAAQLEPSPRRLLDAVAVVPGGAELPLLEAIAGEDIEWLETCLASGMLRTEGQSIGFRHELARLAVEESISPPRRRELHRAALTALTPQQDHARLAHHAEAAGDGDAVYEHARAAAEHAAAVGAHREAAAQYARALRFAGAHGHGEVAELLARRSYECYLTDQVEEGLEARRAALAYYQSVGDRIREGDQQRWISRLSWFAGRNDEAESAAEEAIALLEPTGATRELAMALSNFAQLRMLADDRDAAVKWGERAITLAQRLGDRETLAHALNNVGTVEARRGLGTTRLEASLAIALDDELEEHVARAYTNLGSLAVQQYDHAAATRFLDEGIRYCNERDLDSWRLYMLGWQAQLRLRVGRWDDAAADAQIVVLDPSTPPPTRITALVVLGQLRARRGDPQPLELLDEALTLAEPTGELQRLGPVGVARTEAAFLIGRNDDVVAEAQRLSLPELTDRWVAGELAIFLHRVGADVRGVGELPEPFMLELDDDNDAAAAAWRKLDCPYHAALAAAWGDSEEALKESHRELTRLGAAATADLVARRARERGWRGLPRGPRQVTRATPGSLTAREIDVLRLVADGLRNNEIAQQLFLSTRTVDHHVSAILRKLEVRTRGQATAAAARLGLLEGTGDAKLGNSADAPDAPRL